MENRSARTSDYFWSYVTSFFVLVCSVLTYRFAGEFLKGEEFAKYTLLRRSISFISPLMGIGIWVALPRFVSSAQAKGSKNELGACLYSASIIALIAITIFSLLFGIVPKFWSTVFFGKADYHGLIYSLLLMLIAGQLFTLNHGFARGRMQFSAANVLYAVCLGIMPILTILYVEHEARSVLMILALINGIICSSILLINLARFRKENNGIKKMGLKVLKFGSKRMVGDFAQAGLIALPSTFAAHFVGLEEAGYLAFGMTLVTLAGQGFAPISLIILPETCRLVEAKKFEEIRAKVLRLTIICIVFSVVLACVVAYFIRPLLRILIGSDHNPPIWMFQVIAFVSPFFALHVCLRSFIDGGRRRAVNSRNLGISFLMFLLGTGIGLVVSPGLGGILAGFSLGLVYLGISTVYDAFRISEGT